VKLKNEYLYCVVQSSGHLCLWSMATNRADAWFSFKRGCLAFKDARLAEVRKEAKARGDRCIRLKVTPTRGAGAGEEGEG
jgi:hypothetical protein